MRATTDDNVEAVSAEHRRRRRGALPFLVLAVGLVVVGVAAAVVSGFEQSHHEAMFRNAAQAAQDRVRSRIDASSNLILATAGAFPISDGNMTQERFRGFVRHLQGSVDIPHTQAVAFIKHLGSESDEEVRAVWGLPPTVALPPLRGGQAPGRDAVVLLVGADGLSSGQLGFDPAGPGEPAGPGALSDVRAAMKRAAEDNVLVPTPVMQLTAELDAERQRGFLIFVPVYLPDLPLDTPAQRLAALDGYVMGAFRTSAFFRRIFGTEEAPRVGFEVFDGALVDPAHIILRAWPESLEGTATPFQETVRLRFGARFWMLRIHGRPEQNLPLLPFVLLAGLATAALLFVAMLLQVRGRQAAERTASELRRSSRSLRRSERRLRTLIERLPEAVAVYVDERLVFWNPAMEAMLRPAARVKGGAALEMVVDEDRGKLARALGAFRGGDESGPLSTGEAMPLEVRFVGVGGEAGEQVQTEGFLLPIEFDGLPAVLGVWRDVTQKRQLAARMMQMDRMIAAGTLAAGVAHEINNPLAFVMANLDYARHELVGVSQLAEVLRALDEARDGAERVRRIVRDLKTFSRGTDEVRPPGPLAVDVPRAIGWACAMADNEIRHRARLVLEIDARGVSPVDCDESRLGQVLLNLIMNAAQAIPEGAADRNEIRVTARDEGERGGVGEVVIEVRDTGAGIAPENLGRIFDPFFTTKPVGVGTGLGLAIVQRIVTDNGGHLTVESQLGRGTTFRVSLPAAERLLVAEPLPAPPAADSAPDSAADSAADSAPDPAPLVASAAMPQSMPVTTPASPAPVLPRVLVIDDEIHVLRSIQRGLGRSHELVVLTRAEEALDRIRAGEQFDAIVCDLMMPEMTGMDLHAALTAVGSPAAHAMVFITGGAFTQRAREFLASIDNPYLEKPFEFELLRSTIAARRASVASPSPGA